MLPRALNPQINARCFTAGSPSSGDAAARWIGNASRIRSGFVAVVEGWDQPLPQRSLGAQLQVRDGRLLIGAIDQIALKRTVLQLGERGLECSMALGGYLDALWRPPTPLVMGILNVTPDSFSDGGLWIDAERAIQRGLDMVAEGADVLDIGGESTRPGAEEVAAEEELRRILPVVTGLRSRTKALLSIDTRKSRVARVGLEAGADWINDVSGLTYDPGLADVVAEYPEAKLVLMHCPSRPSAERYSTEWDEAGRPVYEDVVADSMRWLRTQAQIAITRGVQPKQLWIDPGFGFGKTYEQNLDVLRRLREYTSTGLPILVGTSRKSSVGKLVGDLPADQRVEGTAATVAWALSEGASAVRVHDVKEMARIARAIHTLRSSPSAES
jgi:dihydropteroate synthase